MQETNGKPEVDMGTRGYVLVKLKTSPEPERLWEYTERYENVHGVDFADRVVGEYDFVLTVDTKKAFDVVIQEIRRIEKNADILPLTSSNVFDKHREVKNLRLLNDLSSPKQPIDA